MGRGRSSEPREFKARGGRRRQARSGPSSQLCADDGVSRVSPEQFIDGLMAVDGRMRRLAFRMVGGPPVLDDVLQTSYLKAFDQLQTFQGTARFETWLYSIVYRTCVDHLRRRRPTEPLSNDGDPAAVGHGRSGIDPATGVANRMMAEEALASLPMTQRAAVWLVDVEGHSFTQAALVLDEPVGTVASRVSRGRAAMRGLLGAGDEEARS